MSFRTRGFALIAACALLLGLAACDVEIISPPAELLTQKVTEKSRIPVTVLVKNAFSVAGFEKAAEAAFPELDLVLVGNFTSNMGTAEYEARMKNDDLTDIVMTWPIQVGEQYFDDRLLDLSAQPFTSKYNAARLDKVSKNGKIYYLPGPSQLRGIVYNKTMFREKGWAVPQDFEGFISLCKQIESTGIRALSLGLANEEVLDTAFVGFSLADCYSTPASVQWIANYNEGVGKFADAFAPALATFQRLIDEKVLQSGDLKLNYADRENMLFNRKCAMVEDSVLLARRGSGYNGCTDEFGLMPFFNPGQGGDWARLYPVCYIGVNKHLAEPQNKAKYDLVMRIMEYISSPEGQAALMGDTGAMYTSLKGVPQPKVPETADISVALEEGRCKIFPTFKNAQGALRKGLSGMVDGSYTAAQVAQMVDEQNAAPKHKAAPEVIGVASDNFTQIETGSFVCDEMRKAADSDIALFLDNGKDGRTNGKGIGAKLYKGPLTATDIERIMPDYRQNESGELCRVSMTGENLLRTLEFAVPVDNDVTGWFYYFSGLSMTYDVTAQPGARIKKITDSAGKAIEKERVYTVAVADKSVPADAIMGSKPLGITINELLENAFSRGKISPPFDERFIFN